MAIKPFELAFSFPPITPSNMNGRYKVGHVLIDNIEGKGAVPNNQDVDYFGFTMFITPEKFIKLAASGNREADGKDIAEAMKKEVAFGNPFFQLDTIQGVPRIVGHEGRARMLAIRALNGNVYFPVHVFTVGKRARDLDADFFANLIRAPVMSERGVPEHLNALKFFCAGKEYAGKV